MKLRIRLLSLFAFICVLNPLFSASTGFVHDNAQLFSSEQINELNRFLIDFDNSTSNQILVVTIADLNGMDASQYAIDLGEKLGVGGKETDNGIVVLIKPKTTESRGEMFIAVGRGLESVITDGIAGTIRDEQMIPYFKNNDYYGGTINGVQILAGIAKGEYDVTKLKSNKKWGKLIIALIFIIILIISFFKKNKNNGNDENGHTSYGGSMLPWILLGSGGFGGSGSSSGGGGFGGFGGGGFGGGGAGGSW